MGAVFKGVDIDSYAPGVPVFANFVQFIVNGFGMDHRDLKYRFFGLAPGFQLDEAIDIGKVFFPAEIAHAGFVGFPAYAVEADMKAVQTAFDQALPHLFAQVGGVGIDLGPGHRLLAVGNVADQVRKPRVSQRFVHQIGAYALYRIFDSFVNNAEEGIFIHPPHGEFAAGALIGTEAAMGIASGLSLDLNVYRKIRHWKHAFQPVEGKPLNPAFAVLGEKVSNWHLNDPLTDGDV